MNFWTDEQTNLLKEYWSAGWSCAQIASMIGGVSRNAIIGKVHRLKLTPRKHASFRLSPVDREIVRRKKRVDTAQRANKAARLVFGNAPKVKPVPVIEMAQAWEPLGPPISLVDLRDGLCRWPVGGSTFAKPTGFCGLACKGVYCEAHHALSVGRGTPFERAAPGKARQAVNYERLVAA